MNSRHGRIEVSAVVVVGIGVVEVGGGVVVVV